MTATERFLKYITVSTGADDNSLTSPSTERQKDLSNALAEEMKTLGLVNVHVDRCGNAIGTLPATPGITAPVLALVAHVDTAPAASGENVKARIIPYDGNDVELGHGVILSEKQFPAIAACRGQDIIVTDGSTLLGADDKAGVAEIMTAAEMLIRDGLPHGELRLIFTTDEEVGRGTEGLDVKELGCQYGYTVDGGPIGEYEYENFNAAGARLRFHGVGIHPGEAKNIMVNASTVAMEFHALLPTEQVPEKTEGYEGFIHLTDMKGDVVDAELLYIIRDHDHELFVQKKAAVQAAADTVNRRYGDGTVECEIRDTYYNMRQLVEPHMHLIDRIEKAFTECGITPRRNAIRGGTDGATLTWMGLPCPNLSTGGYNFHGVHECIPVESLEAMSRVVVRLVSSFVE